jgi:hypothetical protein
LVADLEDEGPDYGGQDHCDRDHQDNTNDWTHCTIRRPTNVVVGLHGITPGCLPSKPNAVGGRWMTPVYEQLIMIDWYNGIVSALSVATGGAVHVIKERGNGS